MNLIVVMLVLSAESHIMRLVFQSRFGDMLELSMDEALVMVLTLSWFADSSGVPLSHVSISTVL